MSLLESPWVSLSDWSSELNTLRQAYSWDLQQLRQFSKAQGRDKVFVCEFSLAGPSLNSPETVEFAEWLAPCLRFEVWLPASFNNRLSELGAVATAFYSLIIHLYILMAPCLRFEVWLPASFNNRLSELGAVATAFYSLIIHSYISLYHLIPISGLVSTTIPPGMLLVSYRFLSTYRIFYDFYGALNASLCGYFFSSATACEVQQMDFACAGSMLWSYDNRITAWSALDR